MAVLQGQKARDLWYYFQFVILKAGICLLINHPRECQLYFFYQNKTNNKSFHRHCNYQLIFNHVVQ